MKSSLPATCDTYLRLTPDGEYELATLGLAGEPLPGAKVTLSLWHRLCNGGDGGSGDGLCVEAELRSDAQGRVSLGQLGGISRLRASLPHPPPGGANGAFSPATSTVWTLADNGRSSAGTLAPLYNVVAGPEMCLRLPLPWSYHRVASFTNPTVDADAFPPFLKIRLLKMHGDNHNFALRDVSHHLDFGTRG